MFFRSRTFWPLSVKSCVFSSTSPWRSTRARRKSRRRISSLTLPSFLVRRAFMPRLSHASSFASFLSNSASLRSRAANSSSLFKRNLSKPQSKAISLPLSTSVTRVDKFRRKVLSWDTKTIVLPQLFKNFSSQTTESISRWFVGSSRSRTSGSEIIPAPRSARRFKPAEAERVSWSGSSSSLSDVSKILTSAAHISDSATPREISSNSPRSASEAFPASIFL